MESISASTLCAMKRAAYALARRGVTMIEAYILRRNIEKFRRMLDEETDPSTRRAIESMIREFEDMLFISELGQRSVDGNQRSSGDSGRS